MEAWVGGLGEMQKYTMRVWRFSIRFIIIIDSICYAIVNLIIGSVFSNRIAECFCEIINCTFQRNVFEFIFCITCFRLMELN